MNNNKFNYNNILHINSCKLLRRLTALFVVLILLAVCFFLPSDAMSAYTKHGQKSEEVLAQILDKHSFTITANAGANTTSTINSTQSNTLLTASSLHNNINVGWNLGNSLDSHHGDPKGDANLSQETIWGQPKVTKEQIDFVRSLGFNTIRIPVSWYYHSYRDANGTLIIHPDWLKRVKEVVDYAISNDMYVFLDSHHDKELVHVGVSSKEFEEIKSNVISMWTQIAAYFADYDNRLVFEAYNEVDNYKKYWQYGDLAAKQINELNQVLVDTIRSTGGNNAGRILMVPTLLDGKTGKFLTSFKLPKDTVSDRLIVTVHNYAQGFDQAIEASFSELEAFSTEIGATVIIGEWGTTSKYAPAEYRVVHASNYVARAAAHGLKCLYWDNGSNYAIVDRKKLTANMDMVNAIMNPVPYTSDGEIFGNKFDDYVYKTINQKTGEIKEDKHWGTIILDVNGKGYPVPDDAKALVLQLVRSEDMSTHAFHYVYFYDVDGILISCVNEWSGFTEKTVEIPAGTVTVRVGINSASQATKKDQYENAFKRGSLSPVIRFVK